MIQDDLQRKVDVQNRGFGGYNTRWCNIMLPLLFVAADVSNTAGVVVFLGANDANDPTVNPDQAVPLNETQANIESMVNYLLSVGLTRDRILVVTPPPLDDVKWNSTQNVSSKSHALTQEYAEAVIRGAEAVNVTYLDTHSAFMEVPDWQDMLLDGLHFNTSGAIYFHSLISPWVQDRTDYLPQLFPQYQDINYLDPAPQLVCNYVPPV
jgi:lysophospholipase L1-like esterase